MANEVKLKLSLEGGRVVSQEIDGVTYRMGSMRSASISTNASFADLGSQAIALTRTFAGLAAIQNAVTAAGDYAGLTSRMKLLTGSVEQAAIAMQSVQDIAMRQGASLQAVGDSYAKIGQAMLSMGGTSTDTARMVETVAGALRLGNASTQEAASAMRQFGQAMAKGKLNGDEFVSLMENAPYLMDAVAASLGKTKGDLFAMAEAGQLTAQVFGDAVLGSFDAVTGKAATLAPTIGQAMERITTAFTVAASESNNVGLATSAAFGAMGFAADHAAQLLGVLTTGAMVGLANQTMVVTNAIAGKITATLADRAANVANMQSTVASAEAKAIYTGMVLREAQATLAHTTGLGASVVAQNAVIAASAAHTAATLVQTEAQVALNAATSLGTRALGLLGGPIGAVTAVLGLGLTAWSLWGSSAKEGEEKAAAAVDRSTASILSDLDNQIERIQRRNALAGKKTVINGLDLNSPEADRMGAIQLKMDALSTQTGISEEARLKTYNGLLREHQDLQVKIGKLHNWQGIERDRLATESYSATWAKYGPQVDKATAAIEAERKALGAAFTPEMEARIKSHFATHKTGTATITEATKAQKLLNDLNLEAMGFKDDFAAKWLSISKGVDATKGMTIAQTELLSQQPAMVAAAKAEAVATEAVVKANLAASESHMKYVDSLDKGLDKMKADTLAQQESNDRLGLSKEAIAELDAAKLESQAVTLDLLAIKTLDKNLDEAQYNLYKAQADELRKLATLKSEGAYKAAGIDAAKDMAAEQKKAAEESSKYWEDALMRAFESGKGFFQSLWDTIKNTLKTQVLKVTVQGVMGTLGIGAAGSAMAGGSGTGSLLSGASNAYSLYGAATGYSSGVSSLAGLMGAGSTVGASSASMLYANGVSAVGGDGLGALIASNGSWAGVGTGAIGAGGVEGLSAASLALAESNTAIAMGLGATATEAGVAAVAAADAAAVTAAGTSTLTGALGAIPGWGWAALGAVAIASIFGGGGGGPKTESSYGDGQTLGDTSKTGGAGVYVTSIEDSWAALAKTVGVTDELSAAAFYSIDKEGDDKTNFNVSGTMNGQQVSNRTDRMGSMDAAQVGRDDKDLELAMNNEMTRIMFGALQASGISEQAKTYMAATESGLAALTTEADQIQAMNVAISDVSIVSQLQTALELLPFEQLSALSFDAAKGLIEFSGGLANLDANLGTYYANFYTAEEQRLQSIENINAATAGSGLDAATATRETFRTLVESWGTAASLATEEGQKTYAALLGVSGGMGELVKASEDAAKALAEAATKAAADLAGSAYDDLTRAIDAQRSIYEVQVDAAQSAVDEITSVFDVLKANVTELYGTVDSTVAMQAAQGNAFIDQALSNAQTTGYLPDSVQLSDAVAAARGGADSAIYASQQDADFARLELAGRLDKLKTISGDQLATASTALDYAQEQLDALTALEETAKLQLDAFNGISTMVFDIGTAMGAFESAIAAGGGGSADVASTPDATSFGGGGSVAAPWDGYTQKTYGPAGIIDSYITDAGAIDRLDTLSGIVNTIGVATPEDVASLAAFAQSWGYTMQDVANATGYLVDDWGKVFGAAGVPAFANGGYHAGGLALVGEKGPEIVNFAQPSQIYTAGQTQSLMGGNTARLEALIERLTQEVTALKAEARDSAASNRKTADTLVRVTRGGEAMQAESSTTGEVLAL